jgi:cytochrome c biogenesis protein
MSASAPALPRAQDVARRRGEQGIVDAFWEFFASLRFTIPLMFLLAAACTLGTFANPENHPFTEIREAIGHHAWFPIYVFFELNDLFHSWWFMLLLVLLVLNLAACTIERLPRIFKIALRPDKVLSDKLLKGIKHSERIRLRGKSADPTRAVGLVAGLLRTRGYQPEVFRAEAAGVPDDGSVYLFAEKGRYSRFGVWVVHLSLFTILGGALVGRLLGKEGIVNVPMDGGTFDYIFMKTADGVPYKEPLGFTVRIDDFRLKKYVNGNPRSFESDLTLLENPNTPLQTDGRKQTIYVGEPLEYRGWTIYQASYQAAPDKDRVNLLVKDLKTGTSKTVNLARDGKIEEPDGISYQVVNYTPSYQDLGPAVQLLRRDGRKESTFWVFQRYPDFDADNRGDRYGLAVTGLQPFFYSGLQVAKDPGYPFWLVGCCILFCGLGIAFYTSHRRIWARAAPSGELLLAGVAHKNQGAFEQLFKDIVADARSAG